MLKSAAFHWPQTMRQPGKRRTEIPVGTKVTGEIKNITGFSLFVGLADEIDGMVHISTLIGMRRAMSAGPFDKGQEVEAVVWMLTRKKNASASASSRWRPV